MRNMLLIVPLSPKCAPVLQAQLEGLGEVRVVAGPVPGDGLPQVVVPTVLFGLFRGRHRRSLGLQHSSLVQVSLGVGHGVPGAQAGGQGAVFPVFSILQDLT